MGLAPSEIKRMTLWEFTACMDGWARSQGKQHAYEGQELTDEAYDALCDLGDSWNGRS